MATAYVGLGSNMGDRAARLAGALAALHRRDDTRVAERSPVYETRPVGPSTEPFLNQAARIETRLRPRALLDVLLEIERDNGRVRDERWGPRTLDLDLLVYVDDAGAIVELDEDGLTLPHPRMTARDFVLRPLADLAPGLSVGDATVAEHLAAIPAGARTVLARG